MLDTKTYPKGGMEDKIRQVLLSYGEQTVPITIDDLIGKTRLGSSQIYQTLYRLSQKGELELLKDEDSPRPKIVGVKLLRMEPIEKVSERNEEREEQKKTVQELNKMSLEVPNTIDYIEKKIAVEKAREELSRANIDPNTVLNFEVDPLGEEAIILFDKLQNTIKKNNELYNDLEAQKRNAEEYKRRLQTRTFDDSGT